MPPVDPGLNRLAQVAIVCRDIEASAVRWAAVLGLPVPPAFTTPPGLKCRMTVHGQPSDAQCRLAFLKLENLTIELIEPLGGDSSWQEGLDRHGESIHHVAFDVVDLERTLAHFAAHGMVPLHQGRYGGDDGTFVYLDSTAQLGATIEILHSDRA